MIESINTIARLWWEWSAAMFWQVGLLIVLIACIDRLIRRWAWPQLRYALWSLILIKLILPPTLSLPSGMVPQLRPVVEQAAQWMDSESSVAAESPILRTLHENAAAVAAVEPVPPARAGFAMVELRGSVESEGLRGGAVVCKKSRPLPMSIGTPEAATPLNPQSEIQNPQLSWQFYAMAIWLTGTLILGAWLLLRLHSLVGRRANRAAETSLPQSFYSHLAGCAERLGLRTIPRVIVVRQLATPAVFGVFRPVLLMPKGYLSRLSRRDTEHMLLHELAHIRRGDLHAHGLYMLLQIVYWYNPLLWLARRQLHHLRELSCDATVANLLREQTSAYRQTLLETARRFLARSTEPGLGLLGLFEDANRLVVRLDWLAKPTWRHRTMKRAFVLAVVALMFACVLPMAQGQDSAPAVAENKSTDQIEEKTPSSQELAELQARLEKLEVERQKLQKELQMLEQARRKATEAQAQSVEAGKEAKKAKDAADKARLKAKEAQAHAMQAHMDTEEYQQWATEMQAWAEQMQQWQQSPEMQAWKNDVEEWKNSDEWKQWQEDVQKWGKEYGDAFGKAYGGADAPADVPPVRPMPPMPAMPAMPAMPMAPGAPAPAAPHPMPMPMPVLPAMPQVHVPAMPEIHVPDIPRGDIRWEEDGKHDDGKARAEETMHFTSPLVDGGLLIVENRVGAINVRGGSTNECRIDVRVTARAETEEEAQAMAKAVKMTVDNSDARFFIKPVKPDNDDWSNLDVAFEITVPRKVNLQLSTDVGAVLLRDVQGQIKVRANVGAIKTEDVRGDVELETNVGNVDFVAPDDLSAKVTAVTNMGSIKSDLPIQVASKVQAGQGHPQISMGSSAAGTLGAGEGTVKLKSNVGSISIRSKTSGDKSIKVKTKPSSQAAASGVRMVESIKETQEGDQYLLQRTEAQTVTLLPGSVLDVTNEEGAVTVRGTDGKDCSVQAILTLQAPTAEAARQLSKAVSVDLTPSDKGLSISTVTPETMPADHSCSVDLLIQVPRRTDPNITNSEGDVKITNLEGQIKLNVEDGNVHCERLAGDLDLRLEDSQLKIDQSAFTNCRVAMEDGSVQCDAVTGNLNFEVQDGQVKIVYGDDVPETCAIAVVMDDGSIQLSAPSEMFPTDDSAKVRTKEDGAEWKTIVATAQGTRAVTLRTEDGSVKVDRR